MAVAELVALAIVGWTGDFVFITQKGFFKMAAPRAQTLQQKFGFQDLDLLSYTHDEIILWVDQNIEQIIPEITLHTSEWGTTEKKLKNKIYDELQELIFVKTRPNLLEIEEKIKKLYDEISELERFENGLAKGYRYDALISTVKREDKKHTELLDYYNQLVVWKGLDNPPAKPLPKIREVKWEHPILDRNYTIGFVDMIVTYEYPILEIKNDIPLTEWNINYLPEKVAFEIKTSIPSLGELVRQIRMYQTYLPYTKFVVISPDDKFASALKSQNIDFYKYNP